MIRPSIHDDSFEYSFLELCRDFFLVLVILVSCLLVCTYVSLVYNMPNLFAIGFLPSIMIMGMGDGLIIAYNNSVILNVLSKYLGPHTYSFNEYIDTNELNFTIVDVFIF